MFTKILVPLDGTPEAAVALTPARTLARATGATVRLLRVIGIDEPVSERTSAMANLERVAAELRASAVQTDTGVRQGAPAAEIVGAAVDFGADLIAMATHGRSGLARAFLGSVAEGVLATSPVPILLLRPGGHRMSKLDIVLVPVDGSPGGALALASAIALARVVNARIVLLEVVVPILAYMTMNVSAYGDGLYFDPAWDDEALEAAKRYVSGMANRLRQAGVRADGMATMGALLTPATSVAEAIMRGAEEVEANLIVMSTHAHTGPARALLGSVADAVVRNARRPVLLVRRGGARESAADEAGAVARASTTDNPGR